MSVTILKHAVFSDILSGLRNKYTSSEQFRLLAKRAGAILAVESTRALNVVPTTVETPLRECHCEKLGAECVIIPVLRAGLSLVDPFQELLPGASVGHIGLKRDETTAKAGEYYLSLPDLKGKNVIVVDPMLATGGSACGALKRIEDKEAAEIIYVSVVAAPEGIARVQKEYPEVKLYVGAVDESLNARSFIVPGLGDFGDRLYGTIES